MLRIDVVAGAAEASLSEADDLKILIERALSGDGASVRALIDRLSPVIMRRVEATLWRRTGRANAGQEAADMAQEVFVALFQADGRALRSWDPGRGMSFDNFIGLLAQHQVVSILRNKRTSPWREEPTVTEEIEPLGDTAVSPETITSSREDLRLLVDRLRETLSPRGLEVFQRMIIDEEPLEALVARTGMTRDALYQWKSRVLRTVRSLAEEIAADKAKHRMSGAGGEGGGSVVLSETSADQRMVKGAPRS
jgi:RNA polymerase sigma-70 factor (ECF subfamily)